MVSVLFKTLADVLQRQHKLRARPRRRSLDEQLTVLTQAAPDKPAVQALPAPAKLNKPLTQHMLDQAREAGRA